jgi:hypothetical protein
MRSEHSVVVALPAGRGSEGGGLGEKPQLS